MVAVIELVEITAITGMKRKRNPEKPGFCGAKMRPEYYMESEMADTMHALEKNPNWKGRRGPVVLVIMDGVGYGKY